MKTMLRFSERKMVNTVNTIYSHVIHVIPVFGLQFDHCDTLYHCILTKQGQVGSEVLFKVVDEETCN